MTMMMIKGWSHHSQGFLASDANCICPIELFLFVCTAQIYLYARLNHILISLFTAWNFSQACQQSALWWEATSRRMNKWSKDYFPIFCFFLICSNMQILFVQLRYSYLYAQPNHILISLFRDWNFSQAFQHCDERLTKSEWMKWSTDHFPIFHSFLIWSIVCNKVHQKECQECVWIRHRLILTLFLLDETL